MQLFLSPWPHLSQCDLEQKLHYKEKGRPRLKTVLSTMYFLLVMRENAALHRQQGMPQGMWLAHTADA